MQIANMCVSNSSQSRLTQNVVWKTSCRVAGLVCLPGADVAGVDS